MHPLDDHYGLGCVGAAAGAVAIHNAATVWNKALLDNAARPSGALVYDPGEAGAALSGEQFDRLKAEMEAAFQGAGNAGRPMLLEGGLQWRSEEHTSELQSLMRISYAVICLETKRDNRENHNTMQHKLTELR